MNSWVLSKIYQGVVVKHAFGHCTINCDLLLGQESRSSQSFSVAVLGNTVSARLAVLIAELDAFSNARHS